MALMNDVYSYIENNYRPNEPIFLSELNVLGMKSVSVRQQMKKLTESGQLKRFDTGIYYIPKKSMFRSGSTLSVDEVIKKKISGRWEKLFWLCWRYSFCKPTWSDYSGSRSI